MSTSALSITPGMGGVRFQIRVVPRASRSAVTGVRDGRLIVRVTAAPVEGAANEAVVNVIAAALDVPRRAVNILAGDARREKTVAVAGITQAQVLQRLAF